MGVSQGSRQNWYLSVEKARDWRSGRYDKAVSEQSSLNERCSAQKFVLVKAVASTPLSFFLRMVGSRAKRK